jgi:hypothetical protein
VKVDSRKSNILIDKGVITDAEFKQKLADERAVYQRVCVLWRGRPSVAMDHISRTETRERFRLRLLNQVVLMMIFALLHPFLVMNFALLT